MVYPAVCVLPYIVRHSSDLEIGLLQRFPSRAVPVQIFSGIQGELLKTFVNFPCTGIDPDVQIKHRAEYREDHHRQHPHKTEFGISAAAEQTEQYDRHQDPEQSVNLKTPFRQCAVEEVEKQKLYHKRTQDDQRSAEYDRFYSVDAFFLNVFRFHFRALPHDCQFYCGILNFTLC